jgi:D-alanine-D-alanine ligase
MVDKKLNLALIFGGRSSEHDVSVVSALQAKDWPNQKKYRLILIYLDSQNQAFLCPKVKKRDYQQFVSQALERNQRVRFVKQGIAFGGLLARKEVRIDAALLVMHGAYGEDGRIQGLLDFYDIPYTGCGPLASALVMDKVLSKKIFAQMNLATASYLWFWASEFSNRPKKISGRIRENLAYPLFVKPAGAGSSVGISKVEKEKDLKEAINQASKYDQKILVEESLEGAVDINCAVMGGLDPVASVCEQPITSEKFLSFEEKYLKGGKTKGMAGLSRIVPAPIPEKVSEEIKKMAISIFRELNCWGMVRIDFLYQKDKRKIYPNEVNAIPGSLAFYLWKASGVSSEELIDRLVKLAQKRSKRLNLLTYFFSSPILDQK